MGCNARMKVISQIRRERLQMLLDESALSLAEMSVRLGRTARDATLSQILNKAPNTASGKERQMGDAQARKIEVEFGKPAGWLDRDPEFDAMLARVAVLKAAEPTAPYGRSPFEVLDLEKIRNLPADQLRRLEGAFLLAAKQLGFSLERSAAA